MPKMFVDPQRPGIIRWDDDPTAGILAGMRAAEIVRAVNAHDGLTAVIAAAQRWRRAFHHGTRDEIDIQEQCLLDVIAACEEQSPSPLPIPEG